MSLLSHKLISRHLACTLQEDGSIGYLLSSLFFVYCLVLRVSVSNVLWSFYGHFILTDTVPLDHDNWECGNLLRLLSDLQCCVHGLQPSHRLLLDNGETAFRAQFLFSVSHHSNHRTLAKVWAKHSSQFSFCEFVGVWVK